MKCKYAAGAHWRRRVLAARGMMSQRSITRACVGIPTINGHHTVVINNEQVNAHVSEQIVPLSSTSSINRTLLPNCPVYRPTLQPNVCPPLSTTCQEDTRRGSQLANGSATSPLSTCVWASVPDSYWAQSTGPLNGSTTPAETLSASSPSLSINRPRLSPFSTCVWESNPDIYAVQTVASSKEWTVVTESRQYMTSTGYCAAQPTTSRPNLEDTLDQRSSVTSCVDQSAIMISSEDQSVTDYDFYVDSPSSMVSIASQPTSSLDDCSVFDSIVLIFLLNLYQTWIIVQSRTAHISNQNA